MASTKRSSGGTRKSTASRPRATSASKASGTTSAKTQSNSRATSGKTAKVKTGATSARNGARKSQGRAAGGRATASRNGSARSGGSPRNRPASTQTNGTAGTLKQKGAAMLQAAEKANGPALTVAAAVAGLAGGLALRQRPRLTDPGMAARSKSVLRDVDPSAVMEGIGKAAAQLSRRSKVLARELDQVADRAERFGKILS
jgi:DNA-binding protein HU-beta